MKTMNSKNEPGVATGFVTNVDILDMPNSWFNLPGHPKPDTSEPEKAPESNPPVTPEPFTTMSASSSLNSSRVNFGKMPNDVLIKIYYGLLGLIGFYFFLRITLRKRLI